MVALGQLFLLGRLAKQGNNIIVMFVNQGCDESRSQYVRALATYQKAQAQIDALTAGPIELPKPSGSVSNTYRKAKEGAIQK
jgi:hypothetical protein